MDFIFPVFCLVLSVECVQNQPSLNPLVRLQHKVALALHVAHTLMSLRVSSIPSVTHIALSISFLCSSPSLLASRKRPLTARAALACDELSWMMARDREDRAAELRRRVTFLSWECFSTFTASTLPLCCCANTHARGPLWSCSDHELHDLHAVYKADWVKRFIYCVTEC